ncbi:MAG: hypothetical protein IKE21_07700 [Erysipelotrichaceae bacterium]|nr:hypothetical protein [Erysipelotrichaceae bacterium]
MSEKTTKTENTPKKKVLSRPAIILIIGLLIILIPLGVFGAILLHASSTSDKPTLGDRFKNDLDPAITDSDISALETAIGALSGVEKCEIVLTTAQLRVNVDTTDSMSQEEMASLVERVYSEVGKKLPIAAYFTSSSDKKMYDLAISVYNKISEDDESMIYYLLTKNAMMKSPETQLVSEAVNPSLAAELRGETTGTVPEEGAENGEEPAEE